LNVSTVDWEAVHATEKDSRPDAKWLDVDLTGHDIYDVGFPDELFARLRQESPVWRHQTTPTRRSPDGVGFWAVLGHAEVQEVSRNWHLFSEQDGLSLTPSDPDLRSRTLTTSDPPAHSRIRRLISAGFTPRMITRLDELVVRRTTEVLDAAAARETVNFVREVAYALPMHMISDIVGIPESDRPDVFTWTDIIMRANDPRQGITTAEAEAAERSLFAYGAQLGAEKRRNPRDDVWSTLCTAEVEDEYGQVISLRPHELDQFFLLLTIAGSETTRNVISGGLLALSMNRGQMDRLRSDPQLIPVAVEEMLRWTSPVTCHLRTAVDDCDLGGQHILAGDRVAMFFPAANRDPRVFADAHRFNIERNPNPHVSFGGGGVHFCLGAHLARREISVMFNQLLQRFPDLDVVGPVRYLVGAPEPTVAVSPDDLPVRLSP
jgi:cytochrome P450